MTNIPLAQLTFARFAELLHSRFRVHTSPVSDVNLELVEANAAPMPRTETSSASGPEIFSLIFKGQADRPLAQRTYLFEHPRLGKFDLFIVPIGPEQGQLRYEAILNRSLPRPSD